MSIPEMVGELKARYGSLARVARALNVSDSLVYAWRDERAIPTFGFVDKLAAGLKKPREEVRQMLIEAIERRDLERPRHPQVEVELLLLASIPPPSKPLAKANRLHRDTAMAQVS